MTKPEEPIKIDYHSRPKPVEPNTSRKIVGFLGFLVYGVMAAVLWFWTLLMAGFVVSYGISYLTGVAVVLGFVAAFCTWRGVKALRKFLR